LNRIRFDGGVTSDSHDYRRQETLMRTIEREFDLQRVTPSIEVQRHALSTGEIVEGLRTGVPSMRQRLQQLCDGARQSIATALVSTQSAGRRRVSSLCRSRSSRAARCRACRTGWMA